MTLYGIERYDAALTPEEHAAIAQDRKTTFAAWRILNQAAVEIAEHTKRHVHTFRPAMRAVAKARRRQGV